MPASASWYPSDSSLPAGDAVLRSFLPPLLAACTGMSVEPPSDTDVDEGACPELPAAPRPLATGITKGTEGITISPDGQLYVGSEDEVLRIARDGTTTSIASTPGVIGIAWWRDAVWATSGQDDTGEDDPALVEIAADGTTTRHPVPDIGSPNFLTPTPWGTLLVSDPFGTRIYEYTVDGTLTVWLDDLPSPNGMAFDADGTTLFVAHTFVAPSPLHAIPVTDGQPGVPVTLGEFPAGTAPDGVAVSTTGELLVALNLGERVDVWDGEALFTLSDGLFSAASIAFGQPPFDPCALYVTSLFGDTVWEAPTPYRGEVP